MEVSIKLQAEELHKALKKAPSIVEGHLKNMLLNIMGYAEERSWEETPVATGHLRQSQSGRVEGLTIIVAPDFNKTGQVKYATPVHEGSAPHVILPRKKKMLAWKQNGKWIMARRVNHPGNKPNPFYDRALEKTIPYAKEQMNAMLEKTAKSIE